MDKGMTCPHLLRKLRRALLRDSGQDLLEYGLLMSLIVIVALAGVKQLGETVKTILWDVIAALSI